MCVQEYSEEFRDISSKGKRSGHIPEGAITLLNQRTVGDDLPVMILTVYISHSHSHQPLMSLSHTQHIKTHHTFTTMFDVIQKVWEKKAGSQQPLRKVRSSREGRRTRPVALPSPALT